MRIVFLNPSGELGGAERNLLDVFEGLRPLLVSHDSIHLIVFADGPFADAARHAGVNVIVEELPTQLASLGDASFKPTGARVVGICWQMIAASPQAISYIRRLGRTLKRLRPDLIQTNGIKAHLLGTLAAPRRLLPIWMVQDFLRQRKLAGHILRLAARQSRGAIAISQAVADDVKRLAPGLPCHMIMSAIDTNAFSPGPADGDVLDEWAGLPPAPVSTVRVGLVATYARWKGHEVFLQAAARLRGNGAAKRPVRFYIVGGPIYRTAGSQYSRAELFELVRSLGLEGHVGLTGFQTNPTEVYRRLDVVVHASTLPEPFGRTIAEAMACGRAVVVANSGGAAELFSDGLDAVGVPPRDPIALAIAIERLVADPAFRFRLGVAARATAERAFTRDRLGPQIHTVYRHILDSRTYH